MPWSKPDFVEISLSMEATAYVNTDDRVAVSDQRSAISEERAPAASLTADR